MNKDKLKTAALVFAILYIFGLSVFNWAQANRSELLQQAAANRIRALIEHNADTVHSTSVDTLKLRDAVSRLSVENAALLSDLKDAGAQLESIQRLVFSLQRGEEIPEDPQDDFQVEEGKEARIQLVDPYGRFMLSRDYFVENSWLRATGDVEFSQNQKFKLTSVTNFTPAGDRVITNELWELHPATGQRLQRVPLSKEESTVTIQKTRPELYRAQYSIGAYGLITDDYLGYEGTFGYRPWPQSNWLWPISAEAFVMRNADRRSVDVGIRAGVKFEW